MRLRLAPLTVDGDVVPLIDDHGGRLASLHSTRAAWRCRDGDLDARVLSCEPIDLPRSEPTEPVIGALARIALALRGQAAQRGPALLVLPHPARTLSVHSMALAEGVRLLGIQDEADEACWDAALSLGLPVYGVRGTCVIDLMRADAIGAIAALGYGAFTCEDGLGFARLDEDRQGARWQLTGDPDDAITSVIVRGGFEAAHISGARGERLDRGDEGYVRLVARSRAGACWSQPRFIAPRPSGATCG